MAITVVAKIIQPQVGTPIDYSNPITRGVSSLINFNGTAYDTMRGKLLPADSGVKFVPSNNGTAMRGGSGPDGVQVTSTGTFSEIASTSEFSLSMLVRINSLGTRRLITADYNSAGSSAGISIEQTALNYWWPQIITTVPQALPNAAVTTMSVTTGWHWVEITFKQNVGYYVYIDGILLYSDTGSAVNNPRRSSDNYRIGRGGAYTGLPFDGDIAFHGVWNRVITDAERLEIRTNPWQLFAPTRKFLLTAPATSTRGTFTRKVIPTRQPQIGAPLDYKNPIFKELASFITFNGREKDLFGNTKLSRSGSGLIAQATTAGMGMSSNGGSNYFTSATGVKLVCAGVKFSILLTIKLNATGQTNTYAVFDRASGGTGTQNAILYGYTSNQFEFYSPGFSGSDPRTGSGITVADTLPHTIMYTYDGVTWSGFLDGVQVFSVARSFTVPVNDSTGIGAILNTTGANQLNATIINYATWTNGIDASAASSITLNPWQLFAPTRKFLPTAPAEATPPATTYITTRGFVAG